MFDIPLLVFAKAPIAGKVKTRLQSHCTAEQAAEIAGILLERTLHKVCAFWPGTVLISTWLDHAHPTLLALSELYQVDIVTQVSGDLGTKMRESFSLYGYPMAIIGSDAPHIQVRSLVNAHQLLAAGKSVIGPSQDGGYYFIGLSQMADGLFEGPEWGKDTVFSTTLSNSKSIGLKLQSLDSLQDIDTWDDLIAARTELPELNTFLENEGLL